MARAYLVCSNELLSYQLKGRAIEVGGGTLERIPSADLRCPRDLDPDVVIQVID